MWDVRTYPSINGELCVALDTRLKGFCSVASLCFPKDGGKEIGAEKEITHILVISIDVISIYDA